MDRFEGLSGGPFDGEVLTLDPNDASADGFGDEPLSLDDLLGDFGDLGDPNFSFDSNPASDPNLAPSPFDDDDPDDGPGDPGDDEDTDLAPPFDGDEDDDDPDMSGDGDDDDDGFDPDADEADDDEGPGDDEPPTSAALNGGFGGTIECAVWQAVVGQDPNLFELPEDPAISSTSVALMFTSVGEPDGIWIPGFIDGPDGFAEITAVGEEVVIDDTYNAMSVKIRATILEASYDGTTARTVADVIFRFRDEFGNLLIRAKGVVTQEVTALEDGTAAYANSVEYEATLWTPDHTISLDAIEIHDCTGTLE